RSSRTRRETQV
nr:Chain B, Protein E6 [Human papillomavirus 16]